MGGYISKQSPVREEEEKENILAEGTVLYGTRSATYSMIPYPQEVRKRNPHHHPVRSVSLSLLPSYCHLSLAQKVNQHKDARNRDHPADKRHRSLPLSVLGGRRAIIRRPVWRAKTDVFNRRKKGHTGEGKDGKKRRNKEVRTKAQRTQQPRRRGKKYKKRATIPQKMGKCVAHSDVALKGVFMTKLLPPLTLHANAMAIFSNMCSSQESGEQGDRWWGGGNTATEPTNHSLLITIITISSPLSAALLSLFPGCRKKENKK